MELVPSNSSEKDYERLKWESVKSKYDDIRKDFEELYREGDGERSLPHDVALFTRERIETYGKCKKKKPSILVGEVRSKADKYPDTLNACLHDKHVGFVTNLKNSVKSKGSLNGFTYLNKEIILYEGIQS